VLSATGEFLIKDLGLLGLSVWLLADSLVAARTLCPSTDYLTCTAPGFVRAAGARLRVLQIPLRACVFLSADGRVHSTDSSWLAQRSLRNWVT
jgi:hypothetical protein